MATLKVHLDVATVQELHLGSCTTDEEEMAPLFSDVWLGTEVWPAAAALVRCLETPVWRTRLTEARLIVELGAGTGACGLAAAALGARNVLLTDQPALLPACVSNVTANGMEASVRAEALEWAEELPAEVLPQGADLVLMSDCLNPVYGETHAQCLAATLHAILRRATAHGHRESEGLMAQTRRGRRLAEAAFFSACERLGLVVIPHAPPRSEPIDPQEAVGSVPHTEVALDAAALQVDLYSLRLCGQSAGAPASRQAELAELVAATKKRTHELTMATVHEALAASCVRDEMTSWEKKGRG